MELEEKILKLFLAKAKENGQAVPILSNYEKYAEVRDQIFAGTAFYLLVDSNNNVLNLTDVACAVIETDEGLEYARSAYSKLPFALC